MSEKITLTIDNQQVTVEQGKKIVDAAKSAGIDISVFCYHPKLEPVGACRICLVEIGRPQRDRATGELLLEEDGTPRLYFSGNLETACTIPVAEGMVVRTDNEKVNKAREDILEFILTSHPLDCPVCDKGGECSLQELTFGYGLAESRFPLDKKIHLGKQIPLGDLIYLDQERCIQCGRCIRFQKEIAADPVLAFYNRGRKTNIVSYSNPPFDSYWSGNTTDLCPVGALTTKDFRFEARIWEMQTTPSICSHCPVGCNITLNTRWDPKTGRKTIQRVMPRQNEWVNELWICDKGRFAHQFTSSKERLTKPLARNSQGKLKPVSWQKALKIAAEGLKSHTDGLVTLVGGRLTNEDLYQLRQLTDGLDGKPVLDSFLAGGDLTARVGLGQGSNIKDLGPESAILVVASDLEEEAPLWWLRVKAAAERGATLIVANPRETKLDCAADHILRYKYGEETQSIVDLTKKDNNVSRAFKEAENGIVLFGSEGMSYSSSLTLAQACANLLISTKHVGKKNNGLVAVWPEVNTQGAWDMGFAPRENLPEVLTGAKSLIIAGADPVGDGIVNDLSGKFLLVQELFLTETAAQADLVLPVLAATEKSGSFTSGERRVQLFEAALPAEGECLADFEIAGKLGEALGLNMVQGSADEILKEIIKSGPNYESLTLAGLREAPEQQPFVAKEALSYTGTVFKNTSGVGVQLPVETEKTEISPGKITLPKTKFGKGLLAVPVTRLYDQGIMIRSSEVLHPRLLTSQLIINPTDAEKAGLSSESLVKISFGKRKFEAVVDLDQTVPEGVVLVPRSMGVLLRDPENADLKAVK
ncbi:MAG: NADH-quinone oxidoreductase subunit NuoG [Anaerolineales bacterium]|nr:NADH-quinone oxidoreductase subunit NuoG [Anaerolineales bacterium]